jgi:Mg2+ and Co2+ transporter CorA
VADVVMALRYITPTGVEVGAADDFEQWRKRSDGFLWADFPACDDQTAELLRAQFGFHPQAVATCRRRIHLPTFHGYRDHWFVVVHRPLLGSIGHVHLLQIEFFIGPDYVVTLHGPYNPEVEAAAVGRDTSMARDRLDAGRFLPSSPSALAHGILGALSREIRDDIGTIATRVAELERHVIADDLRHPEELLEQMFLIRHELVTVRTMASNAHEIFERMSTVVGTPELDDRALFADLSDRFSRLRTIGDGERDFLAGVIDYYQTRTGTKMMIAMERLAVLAAVTLPITAVASVIGMNVIVNEATNVPQLFAVLALMLVISLLLLRWTKRQGWW